MSIDAADIITVLSIWSFWQLVAYLILSNSETALRNRLHILARRKAVREVKKQFDRNHPNEERS